MLTGAISTMTHRIAFHASLRVLLFVAFDADDFLVTWYKTLVADWLLADLAPKTLFMPLFRFVLEFLHPYKNIFR